MGTTKTALQAGSITRKWIALIEGYSHPLTDATEAQAQAALTGTDWASATIIPGLTVDLNPEQRLDPWQPFHGGGTLSLVVKDSTTDTFGIDTHRKTAGDETILSTSLDSNDTTVTVLSASAFASSGEIHIGTECIGYGGTGATSFTSCTRGKYSPFGVDGGTRFGRPHRVRNDPNGVNLKPLVTEQPRVWLGRIVGLWMHRVVDGVLDTKAQAQCVFAGRIVEIRDDPETQSTIVECEHILDAIAAATLGREMWSAKVQDGVYLETGMRFSFRDTPNWGTTAFADANDLDVVASGASGANQVNAGLTTDGALHAAINNWLASEKQAGRITGSYTIGLTQFSSDTRTEFVPDISGTSPNPVHYRFGMPQIVAMFMGFASQGQAVGDQLIISDADEEGLLNPYISAEAPYRSLISAGAAGTLGNPTLTLYEERGTFADQYASLPASVKPPTNQSLEWGMFVIDDKHVVRAAKDGATLKQIMSPTWATPLELGPFGWALIARRYGETNEMKVRQIFMIEDSFANLVKKLYYSTGTSAYNHATYDTFPYGVGLNCPGVLLGDTFEATVDALPGSQLPQVLVIDKPTTLSDEFTTDLVIRWAFPLWKDQCIQFGVWPTPTSSASVATLSEATKAAPAKNAENHRTASMLTSQWRRSVVKFEYDRDPSKLDRGDFLSTATFEDPRAIDDCGGDGAPVTLQLRHVYSAASKLGVGIDPLIPGFLAGLPMFSRGTWISTRSIDARYWEGYGVGDVVTVTDEFARDPDTGIRGITRYGVIVSHRWQPGGGMPGEARDMSGEVDVMFLEVNRVAKYVPTAQVDDTATNAGYNAGTKVLTCYAHKHSESGESADASYFPAGAKVRVVEIDPSNPASPTTWDDTVASQTGNTITLTTGLAGWDNTLRYRVISDDYGDASTTQQGTYAYQADDADGLVADARVPFEYGAAAVDTTSVTANSATDMIALPPNGAYGDGVGRDIGSEVDLNRLLTALLDYKLMHESGIMSNTAMTGTGVSGTYKLVEIRPVYLGGDGLTASISRNVSVSVWFRSSDGTSSTVRVSLCRTLTVSSSLNDVDRGAVYDSESFTTSSTTWGVATAANLTATIRDVGGLAYLLVECTVKAESRGIIKAVVSPRSYA